MIKQKKIQSWKNNSRKDPSQLELNSQSCDLSHKIRIIL